MLRFVLALARFWTLCYTSGMPDALRNARRREIESDLWESQHDRRPQSDFGVGIEVLLRLLRGVPDDLLWRVELVDLRSKRRRTGVWMTATAGIVLSVALWVASAMGPIALPDPPNRMVFVAAAPPPPPIPGAGIEEPPPPPPPPLR